MLDQLSAFRLRADGDLDPLSPHQQLKNVSIVFWSPLTKLSGSARNVCLFFARIKVGFSRVKRHILKET